MTSKSGLGNEAKNLSNERSESPLNAQSWRPIETAPKDGTMIDVWCSSPDGVEQWRLPGCWWDAKRKKWVNHHAMYDVVTHWMPLPDPPECETATSEASATTQTEQ